MRRFIAASCLLFTLGLLLASSASLSSSELRTMGNRHFEIVGLDLRSVSQMNELSRFTVEISERYLESEGLAYPIPILVSLRPPTYAAFEGSYQIRVSERGAVQVDIRWEASLDLPTAIEAISEALLRQYAIFNFGRDADAKIPAWTVAALADETLIGLRSSWFLDSVSNIRGRPLPDVTAILAPRLPGGDSPAEFGYWLNLSLKSGGVARETIRRLFQMALAGMEIEQALTAAVQPPGPEPGTIDLETWWEESIAALLGREYEVVESMEETRVWLASISNFDAPIEIEGEMVELNLRSLWKHRDSEVLRERIQARYEILRLRMLRANPAYFNAAQSLGSLFEVLLGEGPSHKFIHALAIYLSDMEDAKTMQEAIENKFDF